MNSPRTLIFVYGTLKRERENHRYLRGQKFYFLAQTQPMFRLYDLGGYPGMVRDEEDGINIEGEVWEVDGECLKLLDLLEDTEGGEYVREVVPLLGPLDDAIIEGYRYLRPVAGCRDVGASW